MNRILIWDLPSRIFHWLIVAGFAVAFVLAEVASEKSPLFDAHMLIGLALLPLLLFRVVWGFMGTRYARFRSMLFSPAEAFRYLSGMITRTALRHVGHNPAASYAIFTMLILLAGTVITGLLVPGGGELFEDLHEVLSYSLLLLVGGHLLGLVLHSVLHQENIVLSMLTGKKSAPEQEGIYSSRPLTAVMVLVLTGTWAMALVTTYDMTARRLDVPFTGQSILFGTGEHTAGDRHGDDDD
jgi:cytochrome b